MANEGGDGAGEGSIHRGYDYVIVGGGSAGSVLAHRLSARSSNRVLLIEAGIDTPHGRIPADIHDSYPGVAYFNRDYLWTDLRVTLLPRRHNEPDWQPPLRGYEQARVMGGGSSINGQLANRGSPEDYDGWERMGATGWNWESVLPYFRKVERDMDFEGPYHGDTGRIPVRRIFPEDWPGHAHAVAQAFAALGYEYLEDQNGEFRDGYFPITISNLYDRRVSAAIGYLDPATRQRPNLEIWPETQVTSIAFDGLDATGVHAVRKGGEAAEVRAGEVILCCGAIHSPAKLMRSGIGPAGRLRELGIEVRKDLPGVGQNLMEHPAIGVSGWITPENRQGEHLRRHMQVALRFSSGLHDMPAGDMFVAQFARSAWHDLGKRLGSMLLWVNRSVSTGEVTLTSADPRIEPRVDFALLSDRRDLDWLMAGYRKVLGIYTSEHLEGVIDVPFASAYSDRVRSIATVTARNKAITSTLARMVDGPPWLRRRVIEGVIAAGPPIQTLIADDDALEAFLRQSVHGIWHASCTCRMGADADPMAVTTPTGRVRGVGRLRVCDASIMPAVPCANTNFPTLMSAEKIADAILEGR